MVDYTKMAEALKAMDHFDQKKKDAKAALKTAAKKIKSVNSAIEKMAGNPSEDLEEALELLHTVFEAFSGEESPKRRGRPAKVESEDDEAPKKRRGRPKKVEDDIESEDDDDEAPKKRRGRPAKVESDNEDEDEILPRKKRSKKIVVEKSDSDEDDFDFAD